MFVVRPKGILGTPRALARELGWRMRKFPSDYVKTYDYQRDFFMIPVPPEQVRYKTPQYAAAYDFLTRDKYGQRQLLASHGIPTPDTVSRRADAWGFSFDPGLRFVVRPLRHSGGRHYRVTGNPLDFNDTREYISVLYPKEREYRVIFVFGTPLVYLRKRPHDGVTADEPWGADNASFRTINDPENCKLTKTDCVQRLAAFPPIQGAHIIAADILYNSKHEKPYVVLELNNCPGLDIDNNRAKIVQCIQQRGW